MPTPSASAVAPVLQDRLASLRNILQEKLLPALKQRRWQLITGTALIAVVLTIIFWSSSTSLRPLFGRQERYDTASVLEILDTSRIPYSLHPDSGQILVDQTRLSQARMSLAANGITPDVPAGMELLSTEGELGRSQFVEQARYTEGLQGELAKTIISLRAVRNARVHLAIPKRSSFVREIPEPTASVFLDLHPGARLKSQQIQAIVNLVSGSVPDLIPEKITVLDQNGNMLSATSADGIPDWQLEHTQKRESALARRITSLLEPVVGAGNLRVQVTADIDYNAQEISKESYNPDASAVRSENLTNNDQTTAAVGGIPGVESNQTASVSVSDRNNVARSSSRTQRSYELDRTITINRKAPGTLQKISIGIVVNALAAQGENGWTPEALQTMDNLVSNAVGLEPDRGDNLSLYSLPFTATPVSAEPRLWYNLLEGEYGQYLMTAVAALLLLFIGLILRICFYRKQVRKQRDQVLKVENLRNKESKDAVEDGLSLAVHPDDNVIERARQLSLRRPEQVALTLEKWLEGS